MTDASVDVGYDEEQVNRSIAQVEDGAATCASDNAKRCENLAALQSETQWGVEPGALAFQSHYVEQLVDLQGKLNTLKANLDNFTAGLRSCVAELQATDGDAKAGLDALKSVLTPPSETVHPGGPISLNPSASPHPRQES
ncbi:hypothetical protein [Arachnia propionica]|uniref:Uncharacterized protein n=1 Tax=Arachnia propionica TaxID=1750 RepID=A0A3P1WPE3_9ACTN|nr:hypothetical protein [Arachnia propionica]RRD47220.1 hypothetical protein EII35_15230 [Arachnia propionica]